MATTVLTSSKSMIGRGSWGSQPCRVDITGWERRVKNVKETQARICEQVVSWGLGELFRRTVQNVSAPGTPYASGRGVLTNAGRLPVPVVTGQLRRSISQIRFNTVFGAVWSDPRKAWYNKIIHDGYRIPIKRKTKKEGAKEFWIMKPRPFLQAAVDLERPRLLEYMKKRILEEVQRVGGQISMGF